MGLAVFSALFATGHSAFSTTGLLFFAAGSPRRLRDCFRLLQRLDAAPVVRRLAVRVGLVRQPEEVRPSEALVAGAAALGHLDEAERFQLAHPGPDGMAVDAVLLELVVGHREATVVFAGVASQLDLDACEDAMRRKGQHAERWRFLHLEEAHRE
jgi:hypothetical protein